MEISGKNVRLVILFSLVILIIPMLIFPARFGTELMRNSLQFILLEFAFYGFVLYFFNRETSLLQLIQNSGLCVMYRLFIGAVFGLFITIAYNMNLTVAVTLGMSSYLPGLLLQALATPFIMRFLIFNEEQTSKRTKRAIPQRSSNSSSASKPQPASFTTSASVSVSKKETTKEPSINYSSSKMRAQSMNSAKINENGFQNAINYIGENGSVQMAALVDSEGLLMAGFQRGEYDPEDIAPFALPISHENADTYKRLNLPVPEKIDLMFEEKRMIIATEQYFSLIVISERTMDDVLHIRINQALEMIRMYTAERYSEKLIGNAERIYV